MLYEKKSSFHGSSGKKTLISSKDQTASYRHLALKLESKVN